MDLDIRLSIEQKRLDSIVAVFGLKHEKTMRQSELVDVLIAAKMKKQLGFVGSNKIM